MTDKSTDIIERLRKQHLEYDQETALRPIELFECVADAIDEIQALREEATKSTAINEEMHMEIERKERLIHIKDLCITALADRLPSPPINTETK